MYKPNRHNAATLSRGDAVKARVAQITTKAGVAVAVTVESLMKEAEEMRLRALESGQMSAAVGAFREKCILSGHRVERREVGAPGEFDQMTDGELRRVLIERIKALGLVPDAESDTRH